MQRGGNMRGISVLDEPCTRRPYTITMDMANSDVTDAINALAVFVLAHAPGPESSHKRGFRAHEKARLRGSLSSSAGALASPEADAPDRTDSKLRLEDLQLNKRAAS